MAQDFELETTVEGCYHIRINSLSIGLDTFHSIEPALREAMRFGKKVSIDLTQVGWANGDFFGYLASIYLNSKPREQRLEALDYMKSNLTLIVKPESRIYKTLSRVWPGIFSHEIYQETA